MEETSFSCGVDLLSESQIVDAVNGLNYSIDNLIANVLAAEQCFSPPSDPDRNPPKLNTDAALLAFLNNSRLSDGNARVFVVEFLLRNLIISALHTHFFEGRHFFGVGNESLHAYLERMMTELIAGGRSLYFNNRYKYLH
jgi:hypothetical protein